MDVVDGYILKGSPMVDETVRLEPPTRTHISFFLIEPRANGDENVGFLISVSGPKKLPFLISDDDRVILVQSAVRVDLLRRLVGERPKVPCRGR